MAKELMIMVECRAISSARLQRVYFTHTLWPDLMGWRFCLDTVAYLEELENVTWAYRKPCLQDTGLFFYHCNEFLKRRGTGIVPCQ